MPKDTPSREDRLAAALRANLLKRKAQARKTETQEPEGGVERKPEQGANASC
ncbi:MAG: hypothetical protein RQ833_09430 [Sphingomonadaceae bacterium]|nr:hypothetical protein [Sphingomonadaceae bacterium]